MLNSLKIFKFRYRITTSYIEKNDVFSPCSNFGILCLVNDRSDHVSFSSAKFSW